MTPLLDDYSELAREVVEEGRRLRRFYKATVARFNGKHPVAQAVAAAIKANDKLKDSVEYLFHEDGGRGALFTEGRKRRSPLVSSRL